MNKTVYILGAGFSIEANAPSQEKLIEKIFEVAENDPFVFNDGALDRFETFLRTTLNIPDNRFKEIPLEDIFTPLDKCLLNNISFRNLDVKQVAETRELIYYLIGKTLQHILRNSPKRYIDTFAEKIVEESKKRLNHNYRDIDSVSVISTNWDILLDNSIKSILDNDFENKCVVDYCSRISSFEINDESVKPGLEILGKGGYIVKLIKLHGSLNWLTCPKCSRIYVDFYNKIAVDQYNMHKTCRHCDKNFGLASRAHRLQSNLIMPTFLKNLESTQYKVLWRAAESEISEADKIVFIGYSLPYADFEMRQLLSRMTKNNAKIEVVDFGEEDTPQIIDLKRKYELFFGRREIKFYLKGTADYVNNDMI